MAILSLVGKLKNMVGIAGRMFTSLAQGNVNIEMISQGASEVNISCVIQGRDAVKALNLIHQSCLQIKVEERRGRGGQSPISALIVDNLADRSSPQLGRGYSKFEFLGGGDCTIGVGVTLLRAPKSWVYWQEIRLDRFSRRVVRVVLCEYK